MTTLHVALDSFRYAPGAPPLLTDVRFDLRPGETLTVLGQNGSGKTTLLGCVLGHLRHYAGTVRYGDRDVGEMSIAERAKVFAYVPTPSPIHQDLTVPDYLVTGFAGALGPFRTPGRDHLAEAEEVLARLGPAMLLDRTMAQLSAGEKQVVTLARAILQHAAILVLDEPTANLDLGHQERTLVRLGELVRTGYGIISTTHNLQHALKLGGRVLLLTRTGALYGDARDILTKATIEAAFDVRVDTYGPPDAPVLAFAAPDEPPTASPRS